MRKPRIYCVDDSNTMLLIYKKYLNELHIEVEIESSSNKAIDQIRNGDYDLILLDIDMPNKNGIQILKEIKKDESISDIPVVVISSIHNGEILKELFENQATLYLRKPFLKEEFLMIIKNQIENIVYKKELIVQEKKQK